MLQQGHAAFTGLLPALDALVASELLQHQHAIMLHQALNQGQVPTESELLVR